VALDGTKVAADASKAANRTEERLRRLAAERAAEHAATDAAEDELFGEGQRGDEVPPEVASPASRDERIRRALAELEAERHAAQQQRDQQAQAYLQALESGVAPAGSVPVAAAVAAARLRLERAEGAQRAKVAAWERQRAEQDAAGIRRAPGGVRPATPTRTRPRTPRACSPAGRRSRQGSARSRWARCGSRAPRHRRR
jgi:hypothetical protein